MNILFAAVNKCGRLRNKLFHPTTIGARAIILDCEHESVLLVRLSYIKGWYLPGGKVKNMETVTDGLKRELKEEIGFSADGEGFQLFGVYSNFFEGKSDTIIVFVCSGHMDEEGSKNVEIEERRWFPLNVLPEDVSPGTKRRLDEYVRGEQGIVGKW